MFCVSRRLDKQLGVCLRTVTSASTSRRPLPHWQLKGMLPSAQCMCAPSRHAARNVRPRPRLPTFCVSCRGHREHENGFPRVVDRCTTIGCLSYTNETHSSGRATSRAKPTPRSQVLWGRRPSARHTADVIRHHRVDAEVRPAATSRERWLPARLSRRSRRGALEPKHCSPHARRSRIYPARRPPVRRGR
jgi:hypothetical protein